MVLAQDEEERALEAVRAEIASLESRLSRQNAERDANYRSLKSVEAEVASAAKALADIQRQLDEQRARGQALAQDARAADERLDRERAQLAEQVRMTYMTGRQEMLRLLLNQESPARLGRMVVYYDYLNRARSERVEAVSAELRAVGELTAAAERVAHELEALQEARSRELGRLSRSRDERRTVLAKLEEDIASSGDEIGRLRQEEQRLTQLLAELETLLSAFPMDSQAAFPRIKGELAWPVSGAVVRDYGQARASGQLKWNGVVVEAAGGTSVRAVYHGRVVYADWLPGMGLLVIVDHGDGYMSLYGHNEVILKESGDWVAPGEVIAQVGDSGGQSRTALYFEIRHHGEPVDPHPWMGQRLPR
jgi:septal ring factor EnvC (AmiA/AmiB activator)